MAACVIFVEGSRSTDNGDLRSGFNKLLGQANLRQMPTIVMCNDTDGAIRKFRQETRNPRSRFQRVLLLVDLDGSDATRPQWLSTHNLTAHAGTVFFMVQKMEAWFLSQPTVLHAFYQPRLAHALPGTPPAQVADPDVVLKNCTGTSPRKGPYHKTGHGARLLELLDLARLKATFPDVANLLAAL